MLRNDSPIWTPSIEAQKNSHLSAFQAYVEETYQLQFDSYEALHEWSVTALGDFWEATANYFQIQWEEHPKTWIRPARPFYKTQWCIGGTLSYSAHILRNYRDGETAIIFQNESGAHLNIRWNSLLERAARFKKELLSAGVQQGDCVGGYLLNHPDTVAAFLATNALGAIWSCCSPDFGIESVVDRLAQLKPKVLIAHKSYNYNGKIYLQEKKINQLKNKLSSLQKTIVLSDDLEAWDFNCSKTYRLDPVSVPFDHPIWVLFSSGTTGKPKAIAHRTGGMLLEQLKALAIHQDLKAGERFFWNTTTGWMMWNYALGSLLCGGVLCLYDGAPNYPDWGAQWRFAAQQQIHHFGHGAPFYTQCMKENLSNLPALKDLRSLGSTGAPLSADAFVWLQQKFPETQIISLSGGTDVCTAFIGGCLQKPVYAGWLQAPMLGAAIESWSPEGKPLHGTMGELVIGQPMPCMPVCFWNDPEDQKYHASYFDGFKGVWTHGDYILMDPTKGVQIFGRSDATLNRGGVRIGTSEIYSALDQIQGVDDQLMVDLPSGENWSGLILFVVSSQELDTNIIQKLKTHIRTHCSPRHVPDEIIRVPEIPYTISGKKMEIPVKKICMGFALEAAATAGAMKNPKALKIFQELSEQRRGEN